MRLSVGGNQKGCLTRRTGLFRIILKIKEKELLFMVERITVIGAGATGHGVAAVMSMRGFQVTVL